LTSTILNTLLAGPLGYLSPARQRGAALKLKEEYDVRYPSLEAPMVSLSGGNQQRSVIARWLAKRPVICALDEPTKGIDVGARADVHRLIARLAGEGMAVLLISSDLPELLALSHRVLVMHKGRLVGEIQRDGFDPMVVLRAMSTGRLE
jgi:ABC-type sugar transport system ATPase subunit